MTVTPAFTEPFPQAMGDKGKGGSHCSLGERGFPGALGQMLDGSGLKNK